MRESVFLESSIQPPAHVLFVGLLVSLENSVRNIHNLLRFISEDTGKGRIARQNAALGIGIDDCIGIARSMESNSSPVCLNLPSTLRSGRVEKDGDSGVRDSTVVMNRSPRRQRPGPEIPGRPKPVIIWIGTSAPFVSFESSHTPRSRPDAESPHPPESLPLPCS